ncbi:HAUS augmin-like complex subunit 4 [Chionoecetes opilio]|uniref:HAUS augmin-like complex subunit 4 n=1 Tax=Chionoecetes opilio TaxID=41210 RepID=A0A8J4XVX0_CHIOP|nr:HAUS augmin-like complex subunit 4 [Chionoecetes opilio]
MLLCCIILVSGSLPVYVSHQDVTEHPQLSHLLEDLSLRLTPTGTHKTTHTRLIHASATLKHARLKYLEAATLHRVSQDVLLDLCDGGHKKTKDMSKMLEALTLSELQDHLMLAGSSDAMQREGVADKELTLFGITAEDVLASSKALKPEVYIKDLSDAMETFLEQEWIKISSFINPTGFENCDSQETTKIVDSLETTKQKFAEESNKLTHCVTQTHCLSQKVFGLLFDYSNILKSLVSKQRLSLYPAHHLATCLVFLKAHFLKLRCLELEILTDSYNSKSVPALKLLQGHLQQRRTQAEESLTKVRHAMDAYKHVDPKFQDLLKEYSMLQEDISFAKMSTTTLGNI